MPDKTRILRRWIAPAACAWALLAPLPSLGGEILWDTYGIPHVYGEDVPTVIRGFAYAQMEAHAETLLINLAQARGRSAEYFGPGAGNANVVNDIQVHTFGIPQRARRWLAEGGALQRSYLEAAAAGINEYATLHGETIDPSLRQILPVAAEDLLAGFQNTITFTFESEQSNVPSLLAAWQSGQIAATTPGTKLAANLKFSQAAHNGSNGWAVGPQRTRTGNAILIGNPHLPWGNNQPIPGLGIYQWFEANLVVGDPRAPRLNAQGVTFPGSAFLGIAYTDDIGWSHTNNTIKNADLYEITLTGPTSYLWDGAARPLQQHEGSVRVRQPDGSLATQTFPILATVHGPLIAQRGGKALALRVAGLDAPSPVSQYWGMIQAHNLEEFIAANSALQMPFFNVIYGDRGGHIMYLFGGLQPVRPGGSFYDWAGILPGDTSATLWTRTLPWDALPKTIDPPGHFVQNGNDAPWTSTFPQTISYDAYPAWIAPQEMDLRPQHGASFLLSQRRFSADELLAGKMSTHMALADRLLPDLIGAARASGDPTAAAAAAVLAAWSGNADADSRGAVLFEAWYDAYSGNPAVPKDTTLPLYFSYPAFRIGYDPADPLRTPQGLAETRIAVQTLVGVAAQLQQTAGALDVAWGQVHRTVLVTHDATLQQVIPVADDPLSGPDDVFGPVRTVWPFPAPDGVHVWSYGGDGYVQEVEFTPAGAQARALLTYGNSSRPGSSHIADQLPLFDAKRLRPALRTRAAVEAATISRETY
jgi:acyl-homoserine-lactone acylase